MERDKREVRQFVLIIWTVPDLYVLEAGVDKDQS